MEKKAPVRKVQLRDGDVFYVYDKRINKCIREGCEGIVKYGLTLKVNMPNGDTLNTYECNKCHMKYTAYPNYVRLTQTRGLTIYNQDEVAARDRKRAADAAKQAAVERKKALARCRYASQAKKGTKAIAEKKQQRGVVAKDNGSYKNNKPQGRHKSQGRSKGISQ